jgi:hypothetical protein
MGCVSDELNNIDIINFPEEGNGTCPVPVRTGSVRNRIFEHYYGAMRHRLAMVLPCYGTMNGPDLPVWHKFCSGNANLPRFLSAPP